MSVPIYTKWLQASCEGDLQEMSMLLSHDPELMHAQDKNERCALYLSAQAGNLETVRWLVGQGARLDGDEKPLAAAFIGGSKEVAEYLLGIEAPLSPNYSVEGMRWFCWLAKHQSAEMVGFALSCSDYLELDAPQKEQAVWLAVSAGRLDTIEQFIRDGMRLSSKQHKYRMAPSIERLEHGKLPMIGCLSRLGCINGPSDRVLAVAQMLRHNSSEWQELVAFAIEQGAAIHHAGQRMGVMHAVCAQGNVEAMRVLLAHGVDPNHVIEGGHVPLMWVRGENCLEAASLLLNAGAKIDTRSDDGATVLHNVGTWLTVELADLLIGAGADLSSTDIKGNTPLHAVADHNQDVVVAEHLVLLGADPLAVNEQGHRPGESSPLGAEVATSLQSLGQRIRLASSSPGALRHHSRRI